MGLTVGERLGAPGVGEIGAQGTGEDVTPLRNPIDAVRDREQSFKARIKPCERLHERAFADTRGTCEKRKRAGFERQFHGKLSGRV